MNATNTIRRDSWLLLGFLIVGLIHYGEWEGTANGVGTPLVLTNSPYYIALIPVLMGVLWWTGLKRHLRVFFKFRYSFGAYFLLITALSFLRPDVATSFSNAMSVVLCYTVVFCYGAIAFSLPYRRMVDVFLIFIALIFLPSAIYVHLRFVGPLVLFPDREVSNNLRFGGVVYYAHTAMILGTGCMLALSQFLDARTTRGKLIYGATLGLCGLFLLFTDCRSVMSGLAMAGTYRFLSSLPSLKRYVTITAMAVLGILLTIGLSLRNKPVTKYDTEGDFSFRSYIWMYAFQGVQENPWVGYGSKSYLKTNETALDHLGPDLYDPHNALLGLALQSGVIALVLFLIIYISLNRLYLKHALARGRPQLMLTIFWVYVPLFWGAMYNATPDFIEFFIPLIYVLNFLHPDLYRHRTPVTAETHRQQAHFAHA